MSSVFVIGAGPGIGLAVARRFAADGFTVGLLARTAATVEHGAADLPGTDVATATADVADDPALRDALESLVDRLGSRRWSSTTRP